MLAAMLFAALCGVAFLLLWLAREKHEEVEAGGRRLETGN